MLPLPGHGPCPSSMPYSSSDEYGPHCILLPLWPAGPPCCMCPSDFGLILSHYMRLLTYGRETVLVPFFPLELVSGERHPLPRCVLPMDPTAWDLLEVRAQLLVTNVVARTTMLETARLSRRSAMHAENWYDVPCWHH
jgi:hypothetical protein